MELAKNYKIYADAYGKERNKARELHDQLALRRHQRSDYMRMFGELRADMELKISSYTRPLADAKNVEKHAKYIDSFDDASKKVY